MVKYKVLVRSNSITKIRGDKTRSSKDTSKSTSLVHNLQFRSLIMKLIFYCSGEKTSVQILWYVTFRIVSTFLAADFLVADPSGCAVYGLSLRALACWDCGLESRGGHGVRIL